MNIGITSSSHLNPYAFTLIYMLKAQSHRPICILCTERLKYNTLINPARLSGYTAVARNILQRHKILQSEIRNYLREYALSNNIVDWNLPLSEISKKEGIEYIKIRDINSKDAVDSIKERNIDVLLNAGGGIFKTPIINAPTIGILNAHMGFLPSFRGMNVMEWSLFYDHKIGVTLHFIERGIDTGDILLFKEIPIEKGDTIAALRAKSQVINVELMLKCIGLLRHGDINRINQVSGDGKQYFVMHHRLKEIVEMKLKKIHEK